MKFLTLLVFAFYSGCLYNLVHTPLNIEVGPCFGTCLSYKLEVLPNGAYLLVDNHKTTISKGKLSKKQRKSLKPILAKISVKNQQKNFGNPKIRDLSKIKISFNSTNIEINGRNFAPQPYKSLLKWADEFYTTNVGLFYNSPIRAHFNRTIDGKQISCTDYQKITHNLKEGMFKLKLFTYTFL